MIHETIPRIFNELDAMSRNDPPQRSAEELWKLAKKSKKILYAKKREYDEKSYQR